MRVQYRRKRCRCHLTTVSGLTMTSLLVHPGHEDRSATRQAAVGVIEPRAGALLLQRDDLLAEGEDLEDEVSA